MVRKRKSQDLKPRRRIGFPTYKLFPPSDVLGSHLLALMSAYNDVVRVSDWMHEYQHIPREELATKINNNRRSMQWRLALGIVHEARETVGKLKEDTASFQKLWENLTANGQVAFQALEKLLNWDAADSNPSLAHFLNTVRNRGAFHYVSKHFREGLAQLRKDFGDTDDGFILEGTPLRGRLQFSFADTVRNAAAFGTARDVKKMNQKLERQIRSIAEVVGLLNTFLNDALTAQCQLRGCFLTEDGEHWYFKTNNP